MGNAVFTIALAACDGAGDDALGDGVAGAVLAGAVLAWAVVGGAGGIRSSCTALHVGHSRTWRAMRLRHSAEGWPSQLAHTALSSWQYGGAANARTTARAVSSRVFARCTSTATWGGVDSIAAARSV